MEASGERLEQLISWHKCHSTKIGDTRRWNGWPESFHDLQKPGWGIARAVLLEIATRRR